MDFDRQNKLPEGVGKKKIIEVLKTNRGREIEDSSDYELQLKAIIRKILVIAIMTLIMKETAFLNM